MCHPAGSESGRAAEDCFHTASAVEETLIQSNPGGVQYRNLQPTRFCVLVTDSKYGSRRLLIAIRL